MGDIKSYRDLEIYQDSFLLAKKVHELTLRLPKHEMYEIGSQVRRSSQSIRDNIVEGYGRRQYKAEFIRFLCFAHASLLEATSQLEMIKELYNPSLIDQLIHEFDELGKKIYRFTEYVKQNWRTLPTTNN